MAIETQKLREKRKSSKEEFVAAKTAFDEAYRSIDISTPEGAAMKKDIDQLLMSSANYSSADPMNNRSVRQYATQVYKNALAIINGNYNEAPPAVASSKNMFGGYSQQENINNANALTYKYLNQGSSNSSNVTTPSVISSPTQKNYIFKWNDGMDRIVILDENFRNRYDKFLDKIINNVGRALQAHKSGEFVRGLSRESLNNLERTYQDLVNLKTSYKSLQQNEALAKLLELIDPLEIDGDEFKAYFENYLPQTSELTATKDALGTVGWTFTKTSTGLRELDRKGYKIGTKEGKDYLFDKDYKQINLDAPEIWIDTNSPEGSYLGYAINPDGTYFIGDFAKLDQTSPYYNLYRKYLSDLKNKNQARYNYATNQNYNIPTSYSDNELIQNVEDSLHGKQVIDVSQYFGDEDTEVLATSDDNDISKHIDRWGNLNLQDLKFYFKNPATGQYEKEVPYEQIVSILGAPNMQSEKVSKGLGLYQDFEEGLNGMTTTIHGNTNMNGQDFWSNIVRRIGMSNGSDVVLDGAMTIDDGPIFWVKNILRILYTPDASLSENDRDVKHNWADQNKENIAVYIYGIIRQHPEILNDLNTRSYWKQLLVDINNERIEREDQVQSEKEGGILKAQAGTTVGFGGVQNSKSPTAAVRSRTQKASDENKALQKRASEHGVSSKVQSHRESDVFTTEDKMRAAALVMDIGSTLAAVSQAGTGLFGSATSDALATAATITDFIADAKDPSVSRGQMWANAGINAAFSAVGFAGGAAAKISKRLPTIIKLVTKAVTYGNLGNAVLNPEVRESVSKLLNTGAPGVKPMGTKDWQNIMYVLRAASASTRSVASHVGYNRAVKNVNTDTEYKNAIKGNQESKTKIKSGQEPGQEYIEVGSKKVVVTSAQKNKLKDALKSKEDGTQKFQEELQRIDPSLTQEDLDAVDVNGLFGRKTVKTKINKKSLREKVAEKTPSFLKREEVEGTPEQIIKKLEVADQRRQDSKNLNLPWHQRFLATTDKAISAIRPRYGNNLTLEQQVLLHAANKDNRFLFSDEGKIEREDRRSGTTTKFREKLAKQQDETKTEKPTENSSSASQNQEKPKQTPSTSNQEKPASTEQEQKSRTPVSDRIKNRKQRRKERRKFKKHEFGGQIVSKYSHLRKYYE